MSNKSVNSSFLLPDICRNSSVLILVMAVEVIAIALSLVFPAESFLSSLALYSFYLIWTALLTAFCLCYMRRYIGELTNPIGFLVAFLICLVVFVVVELAAQFLLYHYWGNAFDGNRFVNFTLAACLVYLLILRFFSILGISELRSKTEAEARVQALQSRIRPHFLFNSLNTISELTATEPKQAEEAIASLSSLFRASLDEAKNLHTLDSEIHLCERYLELERWRLGDKLSVTWNLAIENTQTWLVPKLILQPLIENAVVHGQSDDGRIAISVDVKETRNNLSIMVVNIKAKSPQAADRSKGGHGIAVDNIRERLFVLYDDNQAFKIRNEGERYQVIMQIPKQAFADSL